MAEDAEQQVDTAERPVAAEPHEGAMAAAICAVAGGTLFFYGVVSFLYGALIAKPRSVGFALGGLGMVLFGALLIVGAISIDERNA
jgi:hypothetical protein